MNDFLSFGNWWLNLGHVISVEFEQPQNDVLRCTVTLTGHTIKHLKGAEAEHLHDHLARLEPYARTGASN